MEWEAELVGGTKRGGGLVKGQRKEGRELMVDALEEMNPPPPQPP